jgi:zinc finger protein
MWFWMEKKADGQSYTVTCASCGQKTLVVKELYYEVPRFGTLVLISMLCSNCGYRVFDSISLEYKGPKRIEFKVSGLNDLSAKVIRSTMSSITIPELGIELKPGPRSDAFITNIEGLLDRFATVAEQLVSTSKGVSLEKANAALHKIRLAMDGKVPFTLMIEDESGNSAVVPEATEE